MPVAGRDKGDAGDGAFILTPLGEELPRSRHRLLGTILCQIGGRRLYALEGSIFVAGSLIQWLRDHMGMIDRAADTEAVARSVPDNGGVYMLPALAGLGAPHWRPEARARIVGLTHATGRAHIVRAALRSIAHQVHDLAGAFAADGAPWRSPAVGQRNGAGELDRAGPCRPHVEDIGGGTACRCERRRGLAMLAGGTARPGP